MSQLRAILSNRTLTRLLLAQAPADFADWLDFVAIGALLAFHWHVDPVVFACLAVAFGLPYLLVGPVAGALVDRMPLKTVLIASNLGRGLATLALALAPDWPSLLALVLLRNSVDCFFTPAKQAALQALTDADLRMAANGLSHAINQLSKIVAPSLGGALLLVASPSGVFAVNAAVSLLAALLLVGLPAFRTQTGDLPAKASLAARLSEGLAELKDKPLVSGTLGLMAGGYFAMFFYDTLIAPLIRDVGLSETDLGLSLAAVGAGGVAGSLVLGLGAGSRRPLAWIAAGSVAAGGLIGGLGLTELTGQSVGRIGLCLTFFLVGLASAASVVPSRVILQNEVMPDRIGRVTALSEAANAMAMLTAPFLGAALAAAASTGLAFVVGGLLLLVVAMAALVLQNRTARD